MVIRIFKMIATIGFLTVLECIKFVFGRGPASDPNGGGRKAREEGDRKGREGTGPLSQIAGSAPGLLHSIPA